MAGTRAERIDAWFTHRMPSRAEFLATLPRKRITAGVLIRDGAGRVVLVEPTYRRDWLTPGGTVERDESPAQGAAREVQEELGAVLSIGRPLAMQWRHETDDPDGVLHFIYDGGLVDGAAIERFRVPPEELRSYRFVEPAEVPTLASPETSARVAAAIEAHARGTFIEL